MKIKKLVCMALTAITVLTSIGVTNVQAASQVEKLSDAYVVTSSKSKTLKLDSKATILDVEFNVSNDRTIDNSYIISINNTVSDKVLITLEYYSYNKNGKKVKAHDTAKWFMGGKDAVPVDMYGTEVKCTVSKLEHDVTRGSSLPRKHGTKAGVEYKADEYYTFFKNNINACYLGIVFYNNNNYPVEVKCKLYGYDKNGKKLKDAIVYGSTETLYIASNDTNGFSGGTWSKSVDFFEVGCVDYKISYSVKKISTATYKKKTKTCDTNTIKTETGVKSFTVNASLDGAVQFDESDVHNYYRYAEDGDRYYICYKNVDSWDMFLDLDLTSNLKYSKASYKKTFSNKDIQICELYADKSTNKTAVKFIAKNNLRFYRVTIAYYDKDGYVIGYEATDLNLAWDGFDIKKNQSWSPKLSFPKDKDGNYVEPYSMDITFNYSTTK